MIDYVVVRGEKIKTSGLLGTNLVITDAQVRDLKDITEIKFIEKSDI